VGRGNGSFQLNRWAVGQFIRVLAGSGQVFSQESSNFAQGREQLIRIGIWATFSPEYLWFISQGWLSESPVGNHHLSLEQRQVNQQTVLSEGTPASNMAAAPVRAALRAKPMVVSNRRIQSPREDNKCARHKQRNYIERNPVSMKVERRESTNSSPTVQFRPEDIVSVTINERPGDYDPHLSAPVS
jgi:hypothetical protein